MRMCIENPGLLTHLGQTQLRPRREASDPVLLLGSRRCRLNRGALFTGTGKGLERREEGPLSTDRPQPKIC